MHLFQRRIVSNSDASISTLQYRDKCFAVCEDEHRDVKVPRETRIPAGTYEITLRTGSPMARQYRERFGPDHRGIPELMDVPGFTDILIHIGNEEDDTDGCLLPGEHADFVHLRVLNSLRAYREIQRDIQAAIDRGARVFITIIDMELPSTGSTH